MNILFLTYQGGVAGSTNSISYLAQGLAIRGHKVFVGCREDSLLFQMLKDTSVNLVPMTFRGHFNLKNIRQIRNVVKEKNIQIINAQSSKDRYASIFANWFFNLHVFVFHTRRQLPRSSIISSFIYVLGATKIIAVSNEIKRKLIKKGIPGNKISVIYNGTPCEKYNIDFELPVSILRKKYSIGKDDTVIGCVSRLKQQDQLIKALHFIDTPVKVLFVGIEENEALRELRKNLPSRHTIIYTGICTGVEALYHYKLFNIKVLSSCMEGLSQALLEAMALGVPVIATAASGNNDLIKDGVNGFLFEKGNIKQLANKISILLKDSVLRDQFIENGKRTAFEDFSIETTIQNYERFFEGFLSTKSFN